MRRLRPCARCLPLLGGDRPLWRSLTGRGRGGRGRGSQWGRCGLGNTPSGPAAHRHLPTRVQRHHGCPRTSSVCQSAGCRHHQPDSIGFGCHRHTHTACNAKCTTGHTTTIGNRRTRGVHCSDYIREIRSSIIRPPVITFAACFILQLHQNAIDPWQHVVTFTSINRREVTSINAKEPTH